MAATWGWQCTLRPASALPVTAVKSCSRATRYERSRHRLLATSAFRSLGAHRLHGLPEPQPLFQLEAPDLPGNFPAPRTTNESFQPFDEPTIGARASNHVGRTRSRSR